MKKLTLFVAALCMSAMSVMGAEVVAYKLTPVEGSNNGYASSCDVTISEITWNVTGNSTFTPWRLGGKKITATDRAIYSKTVIADAITKIEVVNGKAQDITVNSLKLLVSAKADFSEAEEIPGTFVASDTTTFLCPETSTWSNKYYKFVYNVTNAGSSNKYVEFAGATFYKNVEGAPEAPTMSVVSGVYVTAQSVELACVTTGAKIYYTLDGTEPTTASTLYTAAIPVESTTTIKAIAFNNDVLSSVVSATYVFTSGVGTKENPYTIADVQEMNLYSVAPSTAVWVEGYIIGALNSAGSKIDNTQASNLAIADAATEKVVANMVAVQLVGNSTPRKDLNVVDNPSVIGKKVKVYGSLESYLNLKGVKSTSDYVLETGPTTALENVEALEVYAENGRIYAAEGARIFTVSGIDVTEMNGQLNGIYIVKVGNQATKIAVK